MADTLEEVVDSPPAYAEAVADLYRWSTNFDAGTGPFVLFLDIIGWSGEEYGTNLYNPERSSLGYVEVDKLADALKQYADRPSEVYAWVTEVLYLEGEVG